MEEEARAQLSGVASQQATPTAQPWVMEYHDANINDLESPLAGIPANADIERNAHAPNTRRAYDAGWERWQGWAVYRRARVLPAHPDAVAAYLKERAMAGLSPATVQVDRASIAAGHRAAGAGDPTAHEAVRQLMRCIVRTNPCTRGQVDGVGWEDADRAAQLAESGGSPAGLRDGALIRVGSDAMLRVSELAALDFADVIERPCGDGILTVRRSKTDQEGRGHERYLGPPTIAALRRYRLLVAEAPTDGALFRRINKGGAIGGRLSARSIRDIITRRAGAAGIGGRVSGHSLRVGSAQSLAAAGAGLVDMQLAADWRSSRMPAHYARRLEATRGPVARLRYGMARDGGPSNE